MRIQATLPAASAALLNRMIPFGSKEQVLGLVIEDWIKLCDADSKMALRYIARELSMHEAERVLVSREEISCAIAVLEKSQRANVKLLVSKWRKEFDLAT